MNILDVLIIIPLVWACFKGFKNGLIKEAFSLAAFFLGIYLAFRFADPLSAKISLPAAPLIAFVLLFAGVLLLGWLGARLAANIASKAIPSFIDHLCGILFGAAKIVIICSFVLYFFKTVDTKEVILSQKTTEGSFLYKYVEKSTAFMVENKDKVSL